MFRSFSFLAAGAIALTAACAPAEPTARATAKEAATVPTLALASAPARPAAADANPRLRELIESDLNSFVAGERLNVVLLRRFYARHGYAPVWTSRQPQADSLMKAVSRSGDHGLAPELFHASLLRSSESLPALERELLLSNAFLSYADALARGAMPIERRRDNEALTPEPIDVAAALDAAIGSTDPGEAIEALAPKTPTYRALRQALEVSRSGTTTRQREIVVNLERERWLPRRLPANRVWVNVADQRLVLYRDDEAIFSTQVIVGREEARNQSPEFQVPIDGILFNPPWNIPDDIAEGILAKARLDPNYLAQHNMVRLPDGGVQQKAGPGGALGHLMFEMNNRFDVYLHDTPSKNLFARDNRRISHGCIRVENPRKLASLLMQQSADEIDQTITTGGTTRRGLPTAVPVFIVYETAFADADGKLQFRADFYGRDAEIWQYLTPKSRAREAQNKPASDRAGRRPGSGEELSP